ncbi:hypothetical protein F0Q45_20030 [Mycobacterium simiae]|uniref:Uncharacterized protein n=1 Tax=Mycobacterium simiae TaxID=1784 RepID=A0A5B1BIR5_MYCSI|nr:hypothetical protein [Mycobacterium simiae]KAA1248547.1 hypothetical protein F0Q45_20030 [Mycobacterium simiae]
MTSQGRGGTAWRRPGSHRRWPLVSGGGWLHLVGATCAALVRLAPSAAVIVVVVSGGVRMVPAAAATAAAWPL